MQRPLVIAIAFSIVAHAAAIAVSMSTTHAASSPAAWRANAANLRLVGARPTGQIAAATVASVALPIAAIVPPPAVMLTEPARARVQLSTSEPADIAPPADATLVATTEVPGVALARFGFASAFGGMRVATATAVAAQSSALAEAQHRASLMHADMHARLASAAAMAATVTIASPPCVATATVDCPQQ